MDIILLKVKLIKLIGIIISKPTNNIKIVRCAHSSLATSTMFTYKGMYGKFLKWS